ncbi:hypothetical protein FACS1894171_2550 [Clostridia bacterium]|nr:hypothetical protein FACS1894171_2550 [Clostridia bacterium]
MLDWLYKWVVAVTAAGILAAAAIALAPNGPVQKVVKLTAALLIILSVVSPFFALDLGKLSFYTTQYDAVRDDYAESLGRVNDKYIKEIIEDRASEYILNKARGLGLECSVKIMAKTTEGGYPYPWAAEITYDGESALKDDLSRLIESDCAIPAGRQYWVTTR